MKCMLDVQGNDNGMPVLWHRPQSLINSTVLSGWKSAAIDIYLVVGMNPRHLKISSPILLVCVTNIFNIS